MITLVRYLPLLTTVLALVFGTIILRRYLSRGRPPHLGWWAAGIYIYALGTLMEGWVALFGWHPVVFRLWYITGALLGGAPLAQGSVYFHLGRRTGNILTVCLLLYLLIAATCVMLTPIRMELVEPHRLSGRVMEWAWVRLFSPFVNLYALIFLVGGAAYSAYKAYKATDTFHRFIGNTLIAIGALLPGIGGAFTRFGYTEVLYVMEFIGLLMIWRGYLYCTLGASKAKVNASTDK